MKHFLLIIAILATLVNASLSLNYDRERVEAGKSFGLQLVVPLHEMPENPGALQISTQNGFSLIKLDSTEKVIQPGFDDMFNSFFGGRGRPYKARIYTFKLKAPKKTGKFNIGTITWNINGEENIIANNIPVNVQKSYSDDALSVSLSPSKKTIYEGEQFHVTLSFHTYEHFQGNLQATDMNTGNDFIVHRGEMKDLDFKPVENAFNEMQGSTKFAWLSPTKSGILKIPPFKFKYTKRGEPKIVEENKSHGGFSMHFQSIKQESIDAEASTPTVSITVKPLPDEGKPANFSGMVGNYKFSADVDKTTLTIGEALTLIVKISGDGTPGTITDPKFPDFSDFRSVPPENSITKKISGNKVITSKEIKVFLYPKKKGEFTIPEFTYSWFNPSKKTYESVKAGPWNITVEKGTSPETSFQNPVVGASAVQKQEIEDLGSDIRFIHNISEFSQGSPLHQNAFFWILFFSAIPFYFVVVIVITGHRKHNSNTALVRKGKAEKLLKEKFAAAQKALQNQDGKAFFAALETGLIDYLSNLTNLEFKGMTRNQMNQELENLHISPDTIIAISKWLDKCAFVRYAPVDASNEEQQQMLKDVENLCENLGRLK